MDGTERKPAKAARAMPRRQGLMHHRPESKIGSTYRGVRLQSMSGRSRFTPEEIREAVKAAIAENADVFAKPG